jgi:SAM-dependent methyltransferase
VTPPRLGRFSCRREVSGYTTLSVVTDHVTYGEGIPGDDELHLVGDVSSGRRVLELGLAGNAITLAALGAKTLAVDADPEAIADLRVEAARAGVSIECHHGELHELGFAPSGTIDVVLSTHTLHDRDDLGRTLRQVHRVLKSGAPMIMALDHPFAAVGLGVDGAKRHYGDDHRTIGDLLVALDRANFRIEAFHELGVDEDSPIPTTLVVKARKQGS